MDSPCRYGGLDRFKLLLSFLVIAIHTQPLVSINSYADYVLTHIAARVAVPFFIMVTGFFLLPQYLHSGTQDFKPIKRTIIKLSVLYEVASLIYIPVNMYAGHYGRQINWQMIRQLLFDGTFYHLWYFPALIVGICLVYLLFSKMKPMPVLAVAFVLYVVGMLGDSYYKFGLQIPGVTLWYHVIFSLFSYTRNGLFYVPVFLVIGAMIHNLHPMAKKWAAAGFLGFFALLLLEGMMVKSLHIARHDSMYLMLIPTMYCLFHLILWWQAEPSWFCRSCAAWLYILHPWGIVLVRGAAKYTGLGWLFVDNSWIHYLAVSVISILMAGAVAMGLRYARQNKQEKTRAWIEINRDALRYNAECVRAALPSGCGLMAAVKANAYGHGDVLVARELNHIGIDRFCVATLDEGIRLRKNGVRGEILLLGWTMPAQAPLLKKYRLTQTLVDYEYAQALNASGVKVKVHIALDTGMHRLGERCTNLEQVKAMLQMKNLKVEGLFSHLCVADSDKTGDVAYTHDQCKALYNVVNQLKNEGIHCPEVHLLSSYGALNYPQYAGDYARVGIALYGLLSSDGACSGYAAKLQPVLSLKTRVTCIKTLAAGEKAGYGLDFVAKQPKRMAMIAIGYADGLPRSLSNGVGCVLVGGHKVPVAGRVCMDQTMIDITGLDDVKPGDTVTLIGRQNNEEITAYDVARQTKTITNEILSRLGSRLTRIVC